MSYYIQIMDQIKKIKCFECNSYLQFEKFNSYKSEQLFRCSCKLFDFLFYISPRWSWDNCRDFLIKKNEWHVCILHIKETSHYWAYAHVYEDKESSFTTENTNMDFTKNPIILYSNKDLFEIINSTLQVYSKIQNNLIFK